MDGSPDWQVMRHQSPRTPAAQHVENPIDDFASRVFDIDRLFRYRRDQRLQDFPLRVCQIRGIRFPVCHLFFSILVLFTSSSPSLYRLDHAKQTLSDTVSSVAWSPDGKRIASASTRYINTRSRGVQVGNGTCRSGMPPMAA